MNLAEDSSLYILKTCSKSALSLLSSKVHKPNCHILSSYGDFLRLGIILVNWCWILSNRNLSFHNTATRQKHSTLGEAEQAICTASVGH